MQKGIPLTNAIDIAALFRRHAKMVYRLCYSFLGNAADAEDATQSVFMKLVNRPRHFNDEEHEKAWLIVCAQEAVLALPEKYKTCVYLFYYEGYRTAEIAAMTGVPASTVRSHLSEARSLLKDLLGGEHRG